MTNKPFYLSAALKSEENLLDPQNETSDESEQTGTKNNTSMRVNTSQSETRSPPTRQKKTYQQSDDASSSSYTGSSESESESNAVSRSEEAVVEISYRSSKDQSPRHDQSERNKDNFYDDQLKGPTFTFRSIDPDKNAERMRAEGQTSEGQSSEQPKTDKNVQQEFLAGYKVSKQILLI